VYDVVVNHVRPVVSGADLAAIVPFNDPSHYNTLGMRPNESFDSYVTRAGYPNCLSTFGTRRWTERETRALAWFLIVRFGHRSAGCCGCSAGDIRCDGAEGYNETIVEQGWFFNLADLNVSNTYVAAELRRWLRQMVPSILDSSPSHAAGGCWRNVYAASVRLFC
jgi:hypothetical protein